jgi:hypothetical protein
MPNLDQHFDHLGFLERATGDAYPIVLVVAVSAVVPIEEARKLQWPRQVSDIDRPLLPVQASPPLLVRDEDGEFLQQRQGYNDETGCITAQYRIEQELLDCLEPIHCIEAGTVPTAEQQDIPQVPCALSEHTYSMR